MRSEHLIDAIGGTPLVRLRLPERPDVRAYAKLELNNLFAMKDRVARNIILRARESGALAEGAPLVESSSGTMALGVALVGRALGHPVHIVTDPRVDAITLAKLEALGCAVHIVSEMDEHGWQGARLTRLAEIMAEHPGAFWPRQYDNPDNPAAYRVLAEELVADLGHIDTIVGPVGSGGSLCGTTRALRESLPGLRSVGVDCVGSVLFGQPDWPQRLQSGLGNSMHPPNLDRSVIDEVHWLNDREAFAATRDLAREQFLFAGNTSGSAYRVVSWLAARAEPGATIVGIFPDRGDRYVSTVHNEKYWEERGLAGLPLRTRPRLVPSDAVVREWAYSVPPEEARPAFVFVESNTTGTGMRALATASSLGYRPVFLTDRPSRYLGLADAAVETVVCDTGDLDAMTTALAELVPLEQVSAVGSTSEFYLVRAAELGARLGLPAAAPDAIARCRDKGALRSTLAEAGVPQPAFALVASADEVLSRADLPLPCVVKPVDESGSTGVLRCSTLEEVAAQVSAITAVAVNGRGQRRAPGALVESFADGPEYSVEMIGVDGEPRLYAIVAKSLVDDVQFVEAGHVVPADLPADAATAIVDTVRKALLALGMTQGATHTEVRVGADGPVVIEVNPRLAGGMIPELVRLATGVDLLEQQVRHLGGLPVAEPAPFDGYAGIRFLRTEARGELAEVVGVAAAEAVPFVRQVTVTTSPGAVVGPPTDAYGRLGYVIAHAPSRAELSEALDRATGLVEFHLAAER
ncbi:pyridoxal-phosphate dependent enzyme [Actinokineospora sp. NBRC 105648]|uniref:pyridoxal-phosphate dependent enzyme n=1 Tax=Actinokineospora sp. NBRC 105648 TaxID=3032206 RepID=UPI0024A2A988|nr:pyridoxal-phosphate dependent enzyme [Actinokineospora sp. NBRC 105648]GLZ39379.1 hypothetical protein Acsp05_30030 [Actinokineospora sp. NBRC 105648]